MPTTRRTLLKGAAGAAALSGAGIAVAPPASAAPFIHPGLLHTEADFARMRDRVNAGAQPWRAGWDRLVANPHSQSTWRPNPQTTIIRGGTGQNYGILYNDIAAAYQNALRWKISGSTANGNTARDILNAWSARMTTLTGNADRFLAAGIYGYQFCNAAEIMRGYPGFDLARFQRLMVNVFYPLSNDFLNRHNGACITNYWANWDLCNMAHILALGILNDDQAKFDRAINYFKTGAGNGSILHAIPFLHPGGLAQWQEAGRDQGHTMMGIGLMGTFCEMAWNQGQDMYGYSNNRFLQACEYVARYNLGESVPFTTYRWGSGVNCTPSVHTAISSHSRGQIRPVWETVYNHYVNRRGLSAPYTTRFAQRVRPEGGGGDYGSPSGGYDHLGLGTLTFTRSAGGGGELVGGATYKIRNVATGGYLDSDADGVVIATAVSSYDDQDWVATQQSNGSWTFRNVRAGRYYLDSELNNVVIWNDGYIGPDSQWRLESTSGGFRLNNDRADRTYLYATSAGEVRWNTGSADGSTVWAFERK